MSYSIGFYSLYQTDETSLCNCWVFSLFHEAYPMGRKVRLSGAWFRTEATSHCPGRLHSSICLCEGKHSRYRVLYILKMPIFAVRESCKLWQKQPMIFGNFYYSQHLSDLLLKQYLGLPLCLQCSPADLWGCKTLFSVINLHKEKKKGKGLLEFNCVLMSGWPEWWVHDCDSIAWEGRRDHEFEGSLGCRTRLDQKQTTGTKYRGWGQGSVGMSTCSVSIRSWIWIHSTHTEGYAWPWRPGIPARRQRQGDAESSLNSQRSLNSRFLVQWEALIIDIKKK